MNWKRWAIGLLVLAILAYGVREYAQAREQAKRQSAIADSAVHVADSLSDRLGRLDARLDSAREREAEVRDSLNRELAEAEADETEAVGDVEVAGADLDSTLVALTSRVRPDLKPVARRAQAQMDTLEDAHSRLTGSLRAQVRLLASDTLSMHREIDALEANLSETRDVLASTRSALAEMQQARDDWRDAAHPFGINVSGEVVGLVGLGVGLSTHLLK